MGASLTSRGGRPSRWLPALVLLASALAAAGAPALRWVSNAGEPSRAWVEVSGLLDFQLPGKPAEMDNLLQVRVASTGNALLPAMAGSTTFEKGTLRFRPRFPLQPGLRYVATFEGDPSLAASFIAPAREALAPPRVTKVAPVGDPLPLNLLKFYLHFSAPMTRGRVYQHLHLLEESGRPVADPFLELPEELWNPEMTRLTILLDPGRIKRGLLPNETVGAVLEEGKKYKLVIAREWQSASGQLLEIPFEKSFQATGPDYQQPDPAKWRYRYPAAGTRDPLHIDFAEPLDTALAARVLTPSKDGKLIAGEVALTPDEAGWDFRPAAPWSSGLHHLRIDHRLEDRAGNSIERPFEDALDRHPEEAGKPPASSLIPFTIGAPAQAK